jgi:hypothetical protein
MRYEFTDEELAAHDARVRAADAAEIERIRSETQHRLRVEAEQHARDADRERDRLAAFVADVDLSANEQAARLTLLRQELARTEEERNAETDRADRLAAGVRELADEWACNCGGPSPEGHHEMHCDSDWGDRLRALLAPADDGCTCGHDVNRHDRESGCIECRCRETPADDGEVG